MKLPRSPSIGQAAIARRTPKEADDSMAIGTLDPGSASAPQSLDGRDATRAVPAQVRSGASGPPGPAASALAVRTAQLAGTEQLKQSVQLAELERGEPLVGDPARVREVLGHAVSRTGLEKLYADCLPGLTPVIVSARANPPTLTYGVSWYDNDGEEIARTGRELKRHDDGSLEMHQYGVWVDPEARGRGVSAKAMVKELELLRALNDHPRTRLSLCAGYMNDPDAGAASSQRVGSYAWAKMGYDFGDNHDLEPYWDYGPRVAAEKDDASLRKLSTVELCREQFALFVDGQIAAGNLPDRPEVRTALREAADAWRHPWEIATFHVDGLTVPIPIGGRDVESHLGKAFLTSEHGVSWDASFFVHGDGAGRKVQERYCERSIARGNERLEKRDDGWVTALRSADAGTVGAAVKEIARAGRRGFEGALAQVKKRHPSLADVVDGALAKLKGRGRGERARARAQDPDVSAPERARALEVAVRMTPHTDWDLLAGAVPAASLVLGRAATALLVELEGERSAGRIVDLIQGYWPDAAGALDLLLDDEGLSTLRRGVADGSDAARVLDEVAAKRKAAAEAPLDEKLASREADLQDLDLTLETAAAESEGTS